MARGRPAVVSAIVGIPFVVFGLYVYFAETDVPPEVGIPFYLFGTFVILIGLYIHFVAAPDPPKLAEDEEQIAIRHPTQRVAFVKMLISVPLLFATVYPLLYYHSLCIPDCDVFAGIVFPLQRYSNVLDEQPHYLLRNNQASYQLLSAPLAYPT